VTVPLTRHPDAHVRLYSVPFVSWSQQPADLIDEVLPGLFQGGTPDEDWRPRHEREARPQPIRDLDLEDRFDAVVTLFRRAQPWGLAAAELRYGLPDAAPSEAALRRVVQAARWAHAEWKAGGTVLIRCQAGLNRSGLVTALVLMLDGADAAAAITTVRAARADVALSNTHFVDWLVGHAAEALAPRGAAGSAAA
jgi:protein-tyrosine phosphatase